MKGKIDEKAVSKSQQRFMGMVHAVQKGELDPKEVGKSVRKAAKSMSKKDAKDFAKTKHKGLPEHVDEMKLTAKDIAYIINEAVNIIKERRGWNSMYKEVSVNIFELLKMCENDDSIYEAVKEEMEQGEDLGYKGDMNDKQNVIHEFIFNYYLPEWRMSSKLMKDDCIKLSMHGSSYYDNGDYYTEPESEFQYDESEYEEVVSKFDEDIYPLREKGRAFEVTSDSLLENFEEYLREQLEDGGWEEEENDDYDDEVI